MYVSIYSFGVCVDASLFLGYVLKSFWTEPERTSKLLLFFCSCFFYAELCRWALVSLRELSSCLFSLGLFCYYYFNCKSEKIIETRLNVKRVYLTSWSCFDRLLLYSCDIAEYWYFNRAFDCSFFTRITLLLTAAQIMIVFCFLFEMIMQMCKQNIRCRSLHCVWLV